MTLTSGAFRPNSSSKDLNERFVNSTIPWRSVQVINVRGTLMSGSREREKQFIQQSAMITATSQEFQLRLPITTSFITVMPWQEETATIVAATTDFTCISLTLPLSKRRYSCQTTLNARSTKSPAWRARSKHSSTSWRNALRNMKKKRSTFLSVPATLAYFSSKMPWFLSTIPSVNTLTCWSAMKRLRKVQ